MEGRLAVADLRVRRVAFAVGAYGMRLYLAEQGASRRRGRGR